MSKSSDKIKSDLLSILFGVGVSFSPNVAYSNALPYNIFDINLNYSRNLNINLLSYQIIDLKRPNFNRDISNKDKKNTATNQSTIGYKEELPKTQVMPNNSRIKDSNSVNYQIISSSKINTDLVYNSDLNQRLETSVSRNQAQRLSSNYEVKNGDTLSLIAKKFNLNWEELARVNKIYKNNNYRIYPGQILNLNLESKIANENNATIKSNLITENKKKTEVYRFSFSTHSSSEKLNSTEILLGGENCHKVEVKLLSSKPVNFIAKKANLDPKEVIAQTGASSNNVEAGVYTLCVKKDIETGLIPLHYEYNKKVITTVTGDEVWRARKKFGPFGFARFFGTEAGKCFPSRADRKEMVERFNPFFQEVANKSKYVSADLIKSVTLVESGGNPFCVSEKGAIGLKQLVGENYSLEAYRELKLKNLRKANVKITKEKIEEIKQSKNYETSVNPINPQDSIARGGELLDKLMGKYKDKTLALTAYNQGEARVDAAIAVAAKHGVTQPAQIVRYMSKEARLFAATVIFEGERNGYNPKG